MNTWFKSIPAKLALDPKVLFLVDGIGAFITGGTLFCVATWFQPHFGMPPDVLFILSGIAFMYAMYSITCYIVKPRNARLFLRLLAMANLSYCGLTLLFVIHNFSGLTFLGLTYFLIETVVIVSLVYVECVVSTKLKR